MTEAGETQHRPQGSDHPGPTYSSACLSCRYTRPGATTNHHDHLNDEREAISPFAELSPPYSTIVADPPWSYAQGFTPTRNPEKGLTFARNPLPYSSLSVDQLSALPVGDLAAQGAHLYLWTTNRYLRDAFGLLDAWGFRHSQTLTWCKPPQGIAAGGAFTSTTEFVLFARRGSLAHKRRVDSSWWQWSRAGHSVKPAAFLDLVEQVSPGPYVELFARAPRLGWDSWGHGYELGVSA